MVPLLALQVSTSCTKVESDGYKKGIPNAQLIPEDGPDSVITAKAFDLLNLELPELANVKKYHSEGKEYIAAQYLLDYYRNRSTVNNLNVNLLNPSVSPAQKNMADQATLAGGYRFYVRNYAETDSDSETGMPKYWSFLKEGKIDWGFTPEGVTDQEWFYQKHRLQWMLPQAVTYRVTKDETYMKEWKSIFSNWLETFPCPSGNITDKDIPWYGLQTSERLIDLLSAFEYYKQSENFSPEWLLTLVQTISDHVENIIANPFHLENSNIRLSQYQAITYAGILMPEYARASAWLEYGANGITSSLKGQFNEDGVQNELDPSYHLGVVANFISVYDMAKANNRLDKFPSDYFSYLKKAAKFIADIVYPNYSIDNYNDTRSGSSFSRNVILRNLLHYSSLFPDDNDLLYMSSAGFRGKEPSTDVRIYDKSGYYMFRNGWKSSSTMLVLKNNYNPDNKWHCQPDNGTISLYKDGRRFLPDAGVFTYGGSSDLNKKRSRYRSTFYHNTMTKNVGSSYATIGTANMKGRFLGSKSENGFEYVVTENDSYDDLTHRRTVFFVDKTFFVIVDEGYGSGSGFKPVLAFHLSDTDVETDNGEGVYYGAHTKYSDGNNMIFRTFPEKNAPGYAVSTSTSYYSDVINVEKPRTFYLIGLDKLEGKAARFITVIAPFKNEGDINAMNISARFTDNNAGEEGTFHEKSASVEVSLGGKTYNLSYSL